MLLQRQQDEEKLFRGTLTKDCEGAYNDETTETGGWRKLAERGRSAVPTREPDPDNAGVGNS